MAKFGETSPLRVIETQGAALPAAPQYSILFPQKRDHVLLRALQPAEEHRQHDLSPKHRRSLPQCRDPRWNTTGPDETLVRAIVELKSRNPRFGCPRIARIVTQTFGIDIDKNLVHRVLAKHYRPTSGGKRTSWLSFIGHTTDSLWSVDLFRCESIVLQSYWVLVVLDQFTRRLVGFGVHRGTVTGADVCRMFNAAIHAQGVPRHLSTDHDPLFEAHPWMANLRVCRLTKSRRSHTCLCPTHSWSD
jgi:transposase InsO family protein